MANIRKIHLGKRYCMVPTGAVLPCIAVPNKGKLEDTRCLALTLLVAVAVAVPLALALLVALAVALAGFGRPLFP